MTMDNAGMKMILGMVERLAKETVKEKTTVKPTRPILPIQCTPSLVDAMCRLEGVVMHAQSSIPIPSADYVVAQAANRKSDLRICDVREILAALERGMKGW
jgi:hypothetical protein